MKKYYERPDIFFEDFSLSSSIAGNCEITANQSENICGVKWGRYTVFNESLADVCQRVPSDTGGLYDGLCYHVPEENYNLFNS